MADPSEGESSVPASRSIADIGDPLHTMFPSEGVLLVKDLLPLIQKLEKEKGIVIFGPDESAVVEGIAGSSPDLELTVDALLDLLIHIIPPTEAASPFSSTTDSSVAPPETPSPSTPGGRPRHKRNSSVRIRSASDTSSSDTDEDHQPQVTSGEPTLRFPTAAPPAASTSSESLPATGIPQPVRRKVLSNASSEGGGGRSSAADQAVARVKGTPDPGAGEKVKPPSSWERFQRPGAPHRSSRRKKSSSTVGSSSGMGGGSSDVGSDTEGQNVFNSSQTSTDGGAGTVRQRPGSSSRPSFIRSRQTSNPTNILTPSATPTHTSFSHHGHSASLGANNLPASRSMPDSLPLRTTSPAPGSPTLDERSFFSLSGMMKSPNDSPEEGLSLEGALERQQRESAIGIGFPGMHPGRELSLGEDGAEGEGEEGAGHMRLPRDSSASAHSLSSFHDRVTALDKVNTDLTRKLKAAQLELEHSASEHEQIALDYQNRLDEMRGEVVSKRREEKELRGKERGYLIQIQTFESDISKLHKSLEANKTTYSTLLKNYTEQCGVSEELRNAIRLKDLELRESQENLDAMKSDVDKWTREQEYLEEANRLLLADLATARQAETFLEEQKMENLMLKETINRLRSDLDELRTMSAAGGSGSNSVSRASGRPNSMLGAGADGGTMGRSLEKELLRQLNEQKGGGGACGSTSEIGEEEEQDEDEREVGENESYVETFITRRRRRVVGTRANPLETVHIEDEKEIKEYADASVQATPAPTPSTSISIQTDESTMAGLPAYTPRIEVGSASKFASSSSTQVGEDDDSSLLLSPSSGTVSSREDTSSPALRRRKRESVVQNIYNTFHYTGPLDPSDPLYPLPLTYAALRLAPWVVVSLLLGYYFGSHYATSSSSLDTFSGDLAQWSRYNTLARAQGAGIGFVDALVDNSALVSLFGVVAGAADRIRRVP